MFWECSDSWDEQASILLDDSDGYVAVLRAFLDASSREDTGLFCVAGYVFESGQARRFKQAWRETFGDDKFSWSDLVARAKPFTDLRGRENDDEHSRLIRSGIALIREHTIAGVIVSCWIQDIENFSPRWIRGFSSAYSVCCHFCATGIGLWARDNNLKGGIAYVLEAGDEYADEAAHMLNNAARVPELA